MDAESIVNSMLYTFDVVNLGAAGESSTKRSDS